MMVRLVGHGKRVLDVGCAGGYLSRHLMAAGNAVTGLDSDADAIAEARAFMSRALVADLDERRLVEIFPDETFDAIVFGDVLEHLRDPWRALDDARALLSPQGFAVISIPNVAHGNVRLALLRGAFDYSKYGVLDNGHLRFFTLRSVRELCLRAGFRIEAIERTKVPLFEAAEVVPHVDPSEFSAEVIDEIRSDSEHDTLQFVFRAVPIMDRDHLAAALEALAAAEARLAESEAKVDRLERRLATARGFEERAAEVELLLAERGADAERDAGRIAELEARLGEVGAELEAARSDAGAAYDDERTGLVQEIAALRARDDEREAAYEALREEAVALRAQLNEASRSVGEAYALRAAVDRAHESLATMHDTLQARLSASEAELIRFRTASSVSKVEAEALRRALEELRSDYAALGQAQRAAESAREALAAKLAAAEADARARETAVADTVADLRRSLAQRERDLTKLADERAAAPQGLAGVGPVPPNADALARLDGDYERLQRAHRQTVEAFSQHLDAEIAMLRAEMAEIDGMIKGVQRSPFWSIKAALGRVRRRLPGGRARV
jgi:SAM-dependent methyltransferase